LLSRLREAMFGVSRRVSAVGSGFVDTFLRDNRVIPIVLALLALLVFAWMVAGAFLRGPDEEPVSNRAEVAQAQNPATSDPLAPEVENPDIDTYAAYQFKDPFRQLVAPAETTTTATPTTTPTTTPEDTGGGAGGGNGGGGLDSSDSDGDGLSDKRESNLGLDPANPDTDGDAAEAAVGAPTADAEAAVYRAPEARTVTFPRAAERSPCGSGRSEDPRAG
jgi:hypothetical protein